MGRKSRPTATPPIEHPPPLDYQECSPSYHPPAPAAAIGGAAAPASTYTYSPPSNFEEPAFERQQEQLQQQQPAAPQQIARSSSQSSAESGLRAAATQNPGMVGPAARLGNGDGNGVRSDAQNVNSVQANGIDGRGGVLACKNCSGVIDPGPCYESTRVPGAYLHVHCYMFNKGVRGEYVYAEVEPPAGGELAGEAEGDNMQLVPYEAPPQADAPAPAQWPGPGPAQPSAGATVVHQGVQCCWCKMSPLVGARFMSTFRPDYNLCQTCCAQEGREFEYNRIDKPFMHLLFAAPLAAQLQTPPPQTAVQALPKYPAPPTSQQPLAPQALPVYQPPPQQKAAPLAPAACAVQAAWQQTPATFQQPDTSTGLASSPGRPSQSSFGSLSAPSTHPAYQTTASPARSTSSASSPGHPRQQSGGQYAPPEFQARPTYPPKAQASAPMAPSAPGQAVHIGIACDGCHKGPIVGPRYRHKTKDNYDICGDCLYKENWHDFHRMDKPEPQASPPGAQNSPSPGSQYAAPQAGPAAQFPPPPAGPGPQYPPPPPGAAPTHDVHHGFTCHRCSMSPVIGPMYTSLVRSTYALCGSCYAQYGYGGTTEYKLAPSPTQAAQPGHPKATLKDTSATLAAAARSSMNGIGKRFQSLKIKRSKQPPPAAPQAWPQPGPEPQGQQPFYPPPQQQHFPQPLQPQPQLFPPQQPQQPFQQPQPQQPFQQPPPFQRPTQQPQPPPHQPYPSYQTADQIGQQPQAHSPWPGPARPAFPAGPPGPLTDHPPHNPHPSGNRKPVKQEGGDGSDWDGSASGDDGGADDVGIRGTFRTRNGGEFKVDLEGKYKPDQGDQDDQPEQPADPSNSNGPNNRYPGGPDVDPLGGVPVPVDEDPYDDGDDSGQGDEDDSGQGDGDDGQGGGDDDYDDDEESGKFGHSVSGVASMGRSVHKMRNIKGMVF